VPKTDIATAEAAAIGRKLTEVLGDGAVEKVARRCGFLRRRREITPAALLVACISALGAGTAAWLADILRAFNAFTGKTVRYKPFHNQISKPEFPIFAHAILEELLAKVTAPVLESVPRRMLSPFREVLIHDGTSFALKDALAKQWPGRFTKVSPASVELHVTMSVLSDNPVAIVLAPDKEAERQFAPEATTLNKCLLLEDRGYQDRDFFRAVQSAGGSFIVRGTKSIRPTIREARNGKGKRLRYLEGKRLSWRVLPRHDVDLEIEWQCESGTIYNGRLVVSYVEGKRKKKTFVYLHTNLSRETFSAPDVGVLYKLRWQVELLFKEWKSHANLHKFDSAKAPIAEGLIWASLLAATIKRAITHAAERACGTELSTQRAACSAKYFLDDILASILECARRLLIDIRAAFTFLACNAHRAHPKRDRRTGRLAAGLRHIAAAPT
jgi:Transposase DDE domain